MPPLYGPPTDPAEVAVVAGVGAWVVSACVGASIAAVGVWLQRRSRYFEDRYDLGGSWFVVLGLCLLLTMPAFGMLGSHVWGHYPTIDKAGSLHFYGLGAHFSAFDTSAPATRLIGVSMGHLWFVQLVQWACLGQLPAYVAMNLQGLFNLAFAAWITGRICREFGAGTWASLLAGVPVGLGLHQLRDLNWYTIEKSGTGWLFLFVWMIVLADRRAMGWVVAAAVAYGWAFFYNSYWGVVGAVGAGLALPLLSRPGRFAVGLSALAGLPLVLLQLPALNNDQLPAPQAFAERAALDVLSLTEWNRLELWASLDLVAFTAAVAYFWSTARSRNRRALAAAALLVGPLLLAFGPATPAWTLFSALPGMWRFSKPETFFHLVVLGIAVLAALAYTKLRVGRLVFVAVLQLAWWLLLVRTHPVYPGFSQP